MALLTGNEVKITNVGTGKALQAGGSDGECTVSQSWNRNRGDKHQRWRVVPVSGVNHQYQIENVATGMLLTAGEPNEEAGTVFLGADNNGAPGRWRLIPMADAEYAVISVHNGKAMDLWDGVADDGATIGQFDYWHGPQQRWLLALADVAPRTRAVITMVRNEHVFLPIWLRYYRQFFNAADIYVLDHRCTDGSTDENGFVRVPVSHSAFGTTWQRELVQHHQHELADHYDVVLYTDVDEIVAPDPRYCDLGEYIDFFDQEFVTCNGYEVLHMKTEEPPFDATKPVLLQRSTWYRNPLYSKSLLARVPMLWDGGFHERTDRRQNNDPNLYLIHLHRMDHDICLARHQERRRVPRDHTDLSVGRGYQNQIVDPVEFSHWFYHDSCGNQPIQPEGIPRHWREVV